MRRVGRPAPSPQPSSKMALSMTCWPLHLWWFLTVKQRPTLAQERSLLLHFADCVSPLLLLFLLFWALEFPPSLMQVQGWASESARFPYMHHYLKSLENGNWGKWEASLKWIWAHFMSLLPQSNKTMLARDGVPVEWRPCVPPSREAAFLPPPPSPPLSPCSQRSLLTLAGAGPGHPGSPRAAPRHVSHESGGAQGNGAGGRGRVRKVREAVSPGASDLAVHAPRPAQWQETYFSITLSVSCGPYESSAFISPSSSAYVPCIKL